MIIKNKLIENLDNFPDEFSMDEFIDHLVFINKLENRIQQSNEGKTISENELEEEIKQWLK